MPNYHFELESLEKFDIVAAIDAYQRKMCIRGSIHEYSDMLQLGDIDGNSKNYAQINKKSHLIQMGRAFPSASEKEHLTRQQVETIVSHIRALVPDEVLVRLSNLSRTEDFTEEEREMVDQLFGHQYEVEIAKWGNMLIFKPKPL